MILTSPACPLIANRNRIVTPAARPPAMIRAGLRPGAHLRTRRVAIKEKVSALLAALCLSSSIQSLAEAEPQQHNSYKHAESGYRCPEVLETDLLIFYRSDVAPHPDGRPGIAVAYDSGFKCLLDFYLYRLGSSPIPEGPASRAAQTQFAMSVSQIFRRAEEDNWVAFKRTSLPGSLLQVDHRKPALLFDTFEYVFDGRPFVTWLLLTGSRGHFLEIRYTCGAFSDWSNKPYVNLLLSKVIAGFFEGNPD